MNNNALEQYQFSLNQLLKRLDQQLIELNDDELTYYFKLVKQHIITRPSIDSKYLEFYTRVLSKEHEFLLDDATSGKIKSLTMFDS